MDQGKSERKKKKKKKKTVQEGWQDEEVPEI